METYHTAVQYQMLHAVGLILVGLLNAWQPSRWFTAGGWLMLVGVALFSGLLYAWLATDRRALVHLVPVGGTAFILGWLALMVGAIAALRR